AGGFGDAAPLERPVVPEAVVEEIEDRIPFRRRAVVGRRQDDQAFVRRWKRRCRDVVDAKARTRRGRARAGEKRKDQDAADQGAAAGRKSASSREGEIDTFSKRISKGSLCIVLSSETSMPFIGFQSFQATVVGASAAPPSTYCHCNIFRPSRVIQSQ